MTSTNTPTAQQKTVAQMAAMVGSTLSMMRQLCIDSNNLPENTSIEDSNFKKMVYMEHVAASLNNRTKEEPESFRVAVRIVDDNLATLGIQKDPNVMKTRADYLSIYNAISGPIQKATADRTQLIAEVKEYKKHQTDVFRELGKDFSTKSPAEIQAELDKLKATQKTLSKRVNELVHEEKVLTDKLHPLILSTSQSVRGLGLVPISAESIKTPQIGSSGSS